MWSILIILLMSNNLVIICSLSLGTFPNINIFKHNQTSIDGYIINKEKSPYNHDYPGLSSHKINRNYGKNNIPNSFKILEKSIIVGKGTNDFYKASKLMFSFDMVNNLPWANIVLKSNKNKNNKKRLIITVNTVLCTLIKCYKSVWTLNPVRVCYINRHDRFKIRIMGACTLLDYRNKDDNYRLKTKFHYGIFDNHERGQHKNLNYIKDEKSQDNFDHFPHENNDNEAINEIGYSTLAGHLIAGR